MEVREALIEKIQDNDVFYGLMQNIENIIFEKLSVHSKMKKENIERVAEVCANKIVIEILEG